METGAEALDDEAALEDDRDPVGEPEPLDGVEPVASRDAQRGRDPGRHGRRRDGVEGEDARGGTLPPPPRPCP
jgi:hypothetical protein